MTSYIIIGKMKHFNDSLIAKFYFVKKEETVESSFDFTKALLSTPLRIPAIPVAQTANLVHGIGRHGTRRAWRR